MGDPRIAAARMTDRPQQYDEPTGGSPGIGLTGMDVAGAMAMGGASRPETLMVLYKWVQDRSAQEPLFYVIYDQVVKLAVERKWRVPKGEEYLRRLTRMAIAEVTDPKCCPTCGGRKEVWPKGEGVPVVCPTCGGGGRRDWSDAMRYRAAGIDKRNWERTWQQRYGQVKRLVSGMEAGGLSAIRAGLNEL